MDNQKQPNPLVNNIGLILLKEKSAKLEELKAEKEWQLKAIEDLNNDRDLTDKERAMTQERIGDPLHYDEKEHAELRGAIFLLEQSLMIGRQRIELTPTAKELKGLHKMPFIKFQNRVWAFYHNQLLDLKPGKKGFLDIIEVTLNEEQKPKNGAPILKKV